MRKDKFLMIIGSLLLLTLFIFPLWKITLVAPQYPDPLGLNIHINKLSDGNQYNDVENIDLLNHYIGMAHLPYKANVVKGLVDPFKEFTIIPVVVIVMTILGVIFGIIGNKKLYLTWIISLIILGIIGMYDFYNWLYIYGHHLNPDAILKIVDQKTGELMAYQPPAFGFKQMLNFGVYSYPSTGVYFIFASLVMNSLAFYFGKKRVL